MNGAQFRCWRERLGLDDVWFANYLGVPVGVLHTWEIDGTPPDDATVTLRSIEAHTLNLLGQAYELLRDTPDPTILTFRTDTDFRAAHPHDSGPPFPATWHRALAARLQDDLPELTIHYWSADLAQTAGPTS